MWACYSDDTELPLRAGHPFPNGRARRLRERVAGHLPDVRLQGAEAASREALLRVHTAEYVDAVLGGTLSPAAQRVIGMGWSEQLVQRSRRSVGATLAAVGKARLEGVAANLAGGSHHAHADHGGGYCVFNDVAVAARQVQADAAARGEALRIAVIDLDVHQGDGTAALFAGDPSVFTLSMHGQKNYPFRKQQSDLDVELPDGCGDADYLAALASALNELQRMTADQPPQLLFYLAGADPHEGDRLGRLKLTDAGLRERDARVFAFAGEHSLPLVLTMAGGYGHDVEKLADLQLQTVSLALDLWRTSYGRGHAARE
jgi:acetoin utilization deacetylase AcuC-like enzyme